MNERNEYEYSDAQAGPSEPRKKSSLGCFFYGCLIALVLMLLLVVGGALTGYWFFKGQLHRYTADTPADLPAVEMAEEDVEEIQNRIDTFQTEIEQGDTPADLVLTAEEINALIAQEEELKGKVYVTIDEGQVSGQVSIPTDFIPGGGGRYFNASATFDVTLENGVLIVTLAAADVKGQPVPSEFIEAMQSENLAKDLYNDPKIAETLRKFDSLTIEDDRIILKPRMDAGGGEGEAGDAEAPAEDVENAEEDGATPDTNVGESDPPAEEAEAPESAEN